MKILYADKYIVLAEKEVHPLIKGLFEREYYIYSFHNHMLSRLMPTAGSMFEVTNQEYQQSLLTEMHHALQLQYGLP